MLFATESQKEARKWPKGVPYSINALLTALIPPPTNTVIDMRMVNPGINVQHLKKKLTQLKTENNLYNL